MNQRNYDNRAGGAQRDDNRRDERSSRDRSFSNERDARAERRLADQSDRVSQGTQRASHEYGWNNERNWNDERSDWERHDDGVRASAHDYGQERSRRYGGERIGPSRGYDQDERTFRQSTSGGALPHGHWEHDRHGVQWGARPGYDRDEPEQRSYAANERSFGAPQYGYGPSGYASRGSSYGNHDDRWQASGPQGGDRWQGGSQPGGRGFHGVGSYFGGNHGSYDSSDANPGSDYGGPGAGQRGTQRLGERGDTSQRSHRGVGPVGYSRSDERIKEDVSDALTDHDDVDAREIEVSVKSGEVTLSGSVDARYMKRLAEDIAERVRGVRDVRNELRVKQDALRANAPSGERAAPSHATTATGAYAGSSGSSGTTGASPNGGTGSNENSSANGTRASS